MSRNPNLNIEDIVQQLEQLMAEVLGKALCPRREEQLREAVVPSYLLDEYNRMSAARELVRLYPNDLGALGALSYAAITAPESSLRQQCAQLIADTDWCGREYILICCTYDSDPDVRLLAFEAIAVNRFASAHEVAKRLAGDAESDIYDLANRILRGDETFPVWKYDSPQQSG